MQRFLSIDNNSNLPETLCEAIQSDQPIEKISALLEREDINPNEIDEHGYPPLWLAVLKNDLKLVTLLLQSPRICIDYTDEKKRHVLHLAAVLTSLDEPVLLTLLEHAKHLINLPDYQGGTPLYFAIQQRKTERAGIFLKHGADSRLVLSNGFTLIELALSLGEFKILDLLLADQKLELKPILDRFIDVSESHFTLKNS